MELLMRNSGIITIIGLMIIPLLFIFLIVKVALYYANPPKKKSGKDTISQEQKGIERFSLKLDSQMPKRTKIAAITLIVMFIFSVLNIILLTISLFLISSTTNFISTFLSNAIIIIISLVVTFLAIRLINNRKLSGLIIGFIVAIYCIIIFIFARSLTSIIGLVFGILVIVGLTGKDTKKWFHPKQEASATDNKEPEIDNGSNVIYAPLPGTDERISQTDDQVAQPEEQTAQAEEQAPQTEEQETSSDTSDD